jgi:hypothetical protein
MSDPQPGEPEHQKLGIVEQGLAWLPLALVLIGGALGGVIGVLAVGISHKLMLGAKSLPERYALGLAILVGAVVLYFAGGLLLTALFPGLRR